jgi:hypothetical protein
MRLIVVIWHDSNNAKLNPGMITLVATFPAAIQTLLDPLFHPRSTFPIGMLPYSPTPTIA